jgi:hypothetical protein
MHMLGRRLASVVSLGALSLMGACATGVEDDGFGGLSGAYSAGPSDGSSGGGTEGESEEGDGTGDPATTTGPQPPSDDGSSDDGGNPLCCEAHPQAGCDSPVTESCVCASEPSCCQNVWAQACADLAIACGDPFCEDAGGSSTGDPVEPPEPPPEPPPEDPEEPPPEDPEEPWPGCPCISAPGVDNFCHYGPSYPGCPMTAPGGYCDPNGDGSFVEGDWNQGWFDWHAQCA